MKRQRQQVSFHKRLFIIALALGFASLASAADPPAQTTPPEDVATGHDLAGTWKFEISGGEADSKGTMNLRRDPTQDGGGFQGFSADVAFSDGRTSDKPWLFGVRGDDVVVAMGGSAALGCTGSVDKRGRINARCTILGSKFLGTLRMERAES